MTPDWLLFYIKPIIIENKINLLFLITFGAFTTLLTFLILYGKDEFNSSNYNYDGMSVIQGPCVVIFNSVHLLTLLLLLRLLWNMRYNDENLKYHHFRKFYKINIMCIQIPLNVIMLVVWLPHGFNHYFDPIVSPLYITQFVPIAICLTILAIIVISVVFYCVVKCIYNIILGTPECLHNCFINCCLPDYKQVSKDEIEEPLNTSEV
ncbi:MAG: hypothetical protein Edafosvirus3_28 [Edafosvirus sp.]|uniref:Uncharacterized protein n=1 Tax=Edafosvirus sp. TaxID=2487765 RepID=A0A3G4ZSS4_9VIRU|nr:MAG: hypothetical protein Edafosvirus3_28 [Edafosvirus sp.]